MCHRRGSSRFFRAFVPQEWMKRRPLVIERKCVARSIHLGIELTIRKLERPQVPADAPRHFVARQPVGRARVPRATKGTRFDGTLALVLFCRNEQVADGSEWPLNAILRFKVFRTVHAICGYGLLIEFLFGLIFDQALLRNEARQHAYGEGSTTETEGKDLVILEVLFDRRSAFCLCCTFLQFSVVFLRSIIPADKLVDVENIALEADAECASEESHGLERGGPYTVIVKCNLIRSRQIQRVEGSPDVGAPHFSCRISRAV